MPIAHKSVISFGLVAIPIALYTATRDNDIHFNQLHKEDKSRIRYKKTCAHCGKELTAEDIKELQKSYAKPQLSEQELAMAKTLINSMNTPFNPEAYANKYQFKLRALIESKIAGKEIVTPTEDEPGNIINLMDALKASVKQVEAKTGTQQKQA